MSTHHRFVASAFLVAVAGCAGGAREAVPTTNAPTATTAGNASAMLAAGESLGIAEEIVLLCKLDLSSIKAAPRYEFDRSELEPRDRATLALVADCLTGGALQGRALRLVGRADARGETGYNLALGARRAAGVADYLRVRGVEPARLEVTSRGELDATGTSESGWAVDRRVDLVLAR